MKRMPSPRWTLTTLSLSMVMPSLDTSIANVGLPAVAKAFDASFQEVQWIVLAYLLAVTALIVSAGRLGDLVGRRRLFLVGIAVFTVASLLCGIAPTLWLLVAARAVQGVGAAIMMALTIALAGETIPKARTGRAMGLLGAMSAVGTTLGPSLGGVLIALSGWRAIFLVNVPLGILNLALAFRTLPVGSGSARASRTTLDPLGTFLLVLALALYALALTTGRGSFGPRNGALLGMALAGLGLFAFVETRVRAPLVRLAWLRNPILSAGLVRSALVSTVMMATLVVGPFYLSRALGLDAARVGVVTSIGPLVAALMGVPAGRFVDWFGAQRMTGVGLAGLAAGLFALSTAPGAFGVAGYVGAIVVVTGHYALFQAANNTTVMLDVEVGERGVISGMLSLSRNLGLITGASAMGALFGFATGSADASTAPPAAVAAGMQVTFAIASVLTLLALAIAARRRALPQGALGAHT